LGERAYFVVGGGGWDGRKGTSAGEPIAKDRFIRDMCDKFGMPQASGEIRSSSLRTARKVVPPRASIAVSVLLAPGAPTARWGWLPLLAGLSVVRVLTRVAGLPAVLKWPNDVLVPVSGGELELYKVCGILAETVPTSDGGRVVVLGAGINVSQYVDELPVPQATSLRLAGAAITDRDLLLRAYLRQLAADVRRWDAADGNPRTSGLGAAYREACSTLGRRVEVRLSGRPPLVGVAEGVDDDGRLLVRDDVGDDHAFAAGDVVHVCRR
jgi:BirA family biotin operon repressor/biotin-[acetyl-CoA-carboxylase] ligase